MSEIKDDEQNVSIFQTYKGRELHHRHDSEEDIDCNEFEQFRPQLNNDLVKGITFDIGQNSKSKKKKNKDFYCGVCGIIISLFLFIVAMLLLLLISLKGVSNLYSKYFPNNPKRFSSLSDTDINNYLFKKIKQDSYYECNKIYNIKYNSQNKVHMIKFKYGSSTTVTINVKCDMENHGWTIIQSRGQFENPIDYFSRNWDEYLHGFGDEHGEFWIGLDILRIITSLEKHELLVELWDDENKCDPCYARYSEFYLSNDGFYTLNVKYHSGTAGDGLNLNNGQPFSSLDKDNTGNKCNDISGGWWLQNCYQTNLNALNSFNSSDQIYWDNELNWNKTWIKVEMKIRPVNAIIH